LSRLFSFFSKKDPVAEKIRWLLSQGRIIEGTITKMVNAAGDPIGAKEVQAGVQCFVAYEYYVSGVIYEACQELNKEQLKKLEDYLPGTVVSVRYDPRCPTSCIVE